MHIGTYANICPCTYITYENRYAKHLVEPWQLAEIGASRVQTWVHWILQGPPYQEPHVDP